MASECGIRPAWMVAGLLLVTAITFAGYLITLGSPNVTQGAPVARATVASRPHPAATASTTATTAPQAPSGLRPAVAAFLTAWTTADPAERRAALELSATATLTDQLTITDPEEVPPVCTLAGALQVVDRTPGAVLVTVPTSCEGPLWFGLQVDQTAASGWRVTAIGKERSWIQ